ncbi:Glu-tRNA(Gln) amidotransferase subunit GatE [archaeon]|jgi:glutamyl-tRNA(Gln) amidotransferase subunit E|nr:Glu-tRNA(Gln) amidotransferase subunit GatE [archaeon]
MDLNYEKLGFKAGIEIHQELNTNKLFCNCSSKFKEENEISLTNRRLRAVAGETGKIDNASAYEQTRNRVFTYHGYEDESCLVDLDEEPPHPLDKEAFNIALGVSKLFKLNVPDTICVMRKTVTDGSAVGGFQRTILFGLEGKNSFIKTSKGNVKIEQLNLEEDACKIIKKEENNVHYSLSRLGIPLLELGTDASIKDPSHFKEVALLLGTYLRSFNVKRGIGSIRQDVNVSIKGGVRIEVKGWQDLKNIEELVKNEVLRQFNLLKIKDELTKRGLKKFDKISKDVTELFKNSKSKIISNLIKNNATVYALVLPHFSGLLKKEICTGKTFGRELSEYAKAYGTKGMIHTDEDLSKYNLSTEFDKLKKILKTKKEDLIIIMAEDEDITKKAIDSVYTRALYCLKGIPKETRIPNNKDATSSYARPLPGANRLYPETDIPNINITKKMIDSVVLPELVPDKIKRISKKYNIDSNYAKEIINQSFDVEKIVKKFNKLDKNFVLNTLIQNPKEIKKRYNKSINVEKYFEDLFQKVINNKISKDAVFEILVEYAQNNKVDFSKYQLMDKQQLEKKIIQIINENKSAPVNAIIGIVMGKLRGKAPGKDIVELIKKNISTK